MRIAVEDVAREADAVEQRAALLVDLVARHAPDPERRGEDLADALAGVQRRLRVLEDHLHLAADRLHLPAAGLGDVVAVEADRARGRRQQPHQHADQRRLAAPGLADDPERLAGVEVEGDVVDGVDVRGRAIDDHPGLDREQHPQVVDLEQPAVRTRAGRRVSLRSRRVLVGHQVFTSDGDSSPIRSPTTRRRFLSAGSRKQRSRLGASPERGSSSGGSVHFGERVRAAGRKRRSPWAG